LPGTAAAYGVAQLPVIMTIHITCLMAVGLEA